MAYQKAIRLAFLIFDFCKLCDIIILVKLGDNNNALNKRVGRTHSYLFKSLGNMKVYLLWYYKNYILILRR